MSGNKCTKIIFASFSILHGAAKKCSENVVRFTGRASMAVHVVSISFYRVGGGDQQHGAVRRFRMRALPPWDAF
jgi:hypothetical protein